MQHWAHTVAVLPALFRFAPKMTASPARRSTRSTPANSAGLDAGGGGNGGGQCTPSRPRRGGSAGGGAATSPSPQPPPLSTRPKRFKASAAVAAAAAAASPRSPPGRHAASISGPPAAAPEWAVVADRCVFLPAGAGAGETATAPPPPLAALWAAWVRGRAPTAATAAAAAAVAATDENGDAREPTRTPAAGVDPADEASALPPPPRGATLAEHAARWKAVAARRAATGRAARAARDAGLGESLVDLLAGVVAG